MPDLEIHFKGDFQQDLTPKRALASALCSCAPSWSHPVVNELESEREKNKNKFANDHAAVSSLGYGEKCKWVLINSCCTSGRSSTRTANELSLKFA